MLQTLATAPWLLLLVSLLFLVRRRPRLQDYPPTPAGGGGPGAAGDRGSPPRVSVILPTRNDAARVGPCLATLLACDYPDYEVVVVDHGSVDGTREIVQALAERASIPIRLLRLQDAGLEDAGLQDAGLQDVRGGRPWRARACLLGAKESAGELLLFTEPGTLHASDLLGRAVSALRAEGAALLTVQPRLTMGGFWERLIMPHVWLILRARFPSARLVNRSRRPRNAVAHHQFMLFRREGYDQVGGHAVMGQGPVEGSVEDLAIPQAVMAAGLRVFLVHGDAYLETRLFRTLSDITTDWTAAIPPAARTTVAPWAGVLIPWAVAATPIVFFVLPPLLLAAGLVTAGWGGLALWGFRTSLLSLAFWLAIYAVHRIRPAYALTYPVGALAAAVIFARSIVRHDRAGVTER